MSVDTNSTTTDDSLGTIAELQRDLARQHVNATISELAEMPEDNRNAARDWLVNPRPDAMPPFLVAFYDEPDPIDRDWLRGRLDAEGFDVPTDREITDDEAAIAAKWLRDSQPEWPDWLDEFERPEPAEVEATVATGDAEDAARRLQEIRDAEVAVSEAESEMNAIKEDLKDAKAAYEARVLRLRETIKRQSSPQRELPFGDGENHTRNGQATPPPDPAGDETLDVLITENLQRKLDNPSLEGLTSKKVETLIEACGGNTIARLEKWMRDNAQTWASDIPGFKEAWITRLLNAYEAYRMAFPMPSDEPDEQPLEITDQELANVLMLVELKPSDEQVASWSPAERDAVHEWCDAVFGGRGDLVMPACLADVVPAEMQADPVGYLKGQGDA